MTLAQDDGSWQIARSWYRLHGVVGGPVARLDDENGRPWAELRMLAAVDPPDGRDETLGIDGPSIDGPSIDETGTSTVLTWTLRSSCWDAERVVLEADADGLAIHAEVEGEGVIGEVSLLAGRVILAKASGRLMSGAWFESVVSGGPTDPGRIVRHATESADIGVASGSEPGRGNWFFTPGPFVYAVSREPVDDPVVIPSAPWLSFGLGVGRGEAGFTGFGYRALDRGFGFSLDYEGKTRVAGLWRSPTLLIRPADDPYEAVARWRDDLVAGGWLAPARDEAEAPVRPVRPAVAKAVPDWWRQPMFCGWGAQGALARADGHTLRATARYATQANYDRFLAELAAAGIRPGTIVIDDKWHAEYGTCLPDDARWPDLRGWIAARHDSGQRVLLWYKAWDPEGLPPECCVRSSAGVPLGIDPTNPDAEAAIRAAIRRMLARDGLDADGLKIDFTHRTPSGLATTHHGGAWGVDLLGRLLDIVADEARTVRPEALLIGHSPNPLIARSLGMLRLNDALRLDDPRPLVDLVPQMRHRAALARAACPDTLIDTDDWCAPDRARWRAYAAMKTELGVPALYYTTRLDLSGEPLDDDDHRLIRETWAAYREREGLAEPSR